MSGKIEITNFYLLELTSMSSGHVPEFDFDKISTSYFFIKKNKKGEYCIATPSTGFDQVEDGKVYATYRYSYHQALVPSETYENTMTTIFNHYHDIAYDTMYINEHVNKYLAMKPVGFDVAKVDILIQIQEIRFI